jgi:hypothetical protein
MVQLNDDRQEALRRSLVAEARDQYHMEYQMRRRPQDPQNHDVPSVLNFGSTDQEYFRFLRQKPLQGSCCQCSTYDNQPHDEVSPYLTTMACELAVYTPDSDNTDDHIYAVSVPSLQSSTPENLPCSQPWALVSLPYSRPSTSATSFSTASSCFDVEPSPQIANTLSDDTTDILDSIAELRAAISVANHEIVKQSISIHLQQRKLDNLWNQLNLLARALQDHDSTAQILAKTVPLSHKEFLKYLQNEGLTYLTPHDEVVDPSADFAVAPSPKPGQKPCNVGRPRGKILKINHQDDLKSELYAMHIKAADIKLNVEMFGRLPWECFPKNEMDEEKEQ